MKIIKNTLILYEKMFINNYLYFIFAINLRGIYLGKIKLS